MPARNQANQVTIGGVTITTQATPTNVPHDIGKTLILLFQTSGDPKFNEVFHNKEINEYEQALTQGNAAYGSPDMILDLATSIKEGWTGQFHKVNETAFLAQKAVGPCFNCGGKHSVTACTEPIKKERVDRITEIL
ncbi:unnamed protein product [Cylindrotheca closterium]|uniref:Uncharacterized protein n=1 Tax=Cylindrotheca closterium TaxID=2856 RepID=A0AAD2JPG1_9STRA|nr:unnamed protein product [Cylindrotheca closterium]